MAEYTLYTHPMSRGQIARGALHEAGAEYKQVLLTYGGTMAEPAYLAINPMGKVPAIVHNQGGGDKVVTEAAAICHYLAEASAPALLPAADEKADYFRYLFFAAGPVEAAITAHSMGWTVGDAQKQGMAGFGSYERAMAGLEALLTGRDYVCGDRFTMADVYVGAQVDWGLAFNSIPERPVFEAYAERLRARDAYKAAKAIDMALIEETGA